MTLAPRTAARARHAAPATPRRGRLARRAVSLLAVSVLAAAAASAHAEDPPPSPPPAAEAPPPPIVPVEVAPGVPLEAEVLGPLAVIGERPLEALRTIPGSGSTLTAREIVRYREPLDLQDAVRTLPGVVTRWETASGIIPNIGVRGLNPDRSEKLLILEDGVPAGLAPYVENAAYYVPPFERMARVELLKGSGSILYGPHTVGGVLNLVTPDVPELLSGHVRTVVGSDGFVMGYAEVGQTVGRVGYLVQALGKRGDGFREHDDFDVHDVTAKLLWRPTACTDVTLKLNVYRQDSGDTYLGLTQPMFDADPFQGTAPLDRLDVEWYGAQLTLQHRFSACWRLLTNVYWSKATRDWNRQDYARNVGFAAAPANTVATLGDTAVDGGAVYLRASYGARDRDFEKVGVEPRLIGEHTLFGRPAETHVGLRLHIEALTDERNNATSLHAPATTFARDVRSVDALALFGQERVQVTRRLGLSAGLRVEIYDEERHLQVVSGAPADIRGTTDNVEWIPGAGFTYALACTHTLFGGVHRGFSPPRTAQAISSTGQDLELEAERSWEYELGVRGQASGCGCDWLQYELTGFYYDFENQVVPANQSGGAGTADTNAGQTRHLGLETAFTVDLTRLITGRCDPCRHGVFVDGGYTYVDTENTTPSGTFEGKDLPYAPEHVAWLGLRWEAPSGLSLGISGHYVGDQYADQPNTVAPSATGLVGRIEDRFVVDAMLRWRIPRTAVTATLSVANVFDEEYVASRAPEGIFAGAPRHGMLGVEIDF